MVKSTRKIVYKTWYNSTNPSLLQEARLPRRSSIKSFCILLHRSLLISTVLPLLLKSSPRMNCLTGKSRTRCVNFCQQLANKLTRRDRKLHVGAWFLPYWTRLDERRFIGVCTGLFCTRGLSLNSTFYLTLIMLIINSMISDMANEQWYPWSVIRLMKNDMINNNVQYGSIVVHWRFLFECAISWRVRYSSPMRMLDNDAYNYSSLFKFDAYQNCFN